MRSKLEQCETDLETAGSEAAALPQVEQAIVFPMLDQWRELVRPIYAGTVVVGDDLTVYDVP